MGKINKNAFLKRLQKRIEETSLSTNFMLSDSNPNSDLKNLLQSITTANYSMNNMPIIYSSKRGIVGKVFNLIVKRLYWIIKNTVAPSINTQKNINGFVIDSFKTINENNKKLQDHISNLSSSLKNNNQIYNQIDYSGFEAENRTNEEVLLEKQNIYVKYFEGKENVLDVGCGRGEFLRILEQKGIEAKGIELNENFVNYCQTQGLNVECADMIPYLEKTPDDSLGGIIALQVVEHLTPATLTHFITLAYQKLQPGASIVLETLNPQSLIIFSASFYKDLTHIQPIHPSILQFLLKSVGFNDCIVEYSSIIEDGNKLQMVNSGSENDTIQNQNTEILNNLLFGPQDYAAIGRK